MASASALGELPQGDLRIKLVLVAGGMSAPVFATHAGDGSGRLFIVDQAGKIRIIKNGALFPTPFLDLSAVIAPLNASYDERGLLGLAFHPNYAANGRFFVRYSKARTGVSGEPCFGTSRGCHEEILAEYVVSGNPDVANPAGTILFRVNKPEFNHNGGMVRFGPDGYLYFSLGDGGGANDDLHLPTLPHGPIGNAQNINVPLGKMLRIDVDPPFDARGVIPYGIPADNPFVGTDGLDEVYAMGFRNPFTFTFDDGPGGTGDLYVGDVGQNLYEELDIVDNGGNYGWVIREGRHCFDPFNANTPLPSCNSNGLIDPIAEYHHADGGLAILVGGYYRGTRFPCMQGKFVLGDFSRDFGPTGSIYFLAEPSPGVRQVQRVKLGYTNQVLGKAMKGFGQDEDGELYAMMSPSIGPLGSSGEVYRMEQILDGDSDADCDVDLTDYSSFASCFTGAGGSLVATTNVQVGAGLSTVFTPKHVTIELGDTVHWFWGGGTHNVESGTDGLHDGYFRSGNPTSNLSTTFNVTFNAAFLAAHPSLGNVYPYYCALHDFGGMNGTVTVVPNACTQFDFDGDGDVDLWDYHVLQMSFAGTP
jgi:glucose/arabinose dehydrogenase/plastocyanin